MLVEAAGVHITAGHQLLVAQAAQAVAVLAEETQLMETRVYLELQILVAEAVAAITTRQRIIILVALVVPVL